jgi:hypothetical protein
VIACGREDIGVHMRDVALAQGAGQRWADQNVVEELRATFEDLAVSLRFRHIAREVPQPALFENRERRR